MAPSVSSNVLVGTRYQACLVRLSQGGPLKQKPHELASSWSQAPGFFWLDSSHARLGQPAWSFIGFHPARTIHYRDREASVITPEKREVLAGVRPLRLLEREWQDHAAAPWDPALAPARTPPFCGGWFALLSYDLGREVERLPRRAVADLKFPELFLSFHEVVLAFDHSEGVWWAVCLVPRDIRSGQRERQAQKMADRLLESSLCLKSPILQASPSLPSPSAPHSLASNFTREGYEAAVARALEYIAAGDIYQVNLSQRFQAPWARPAIDLFLALRQRSSTPYGVFANLGEGRAVSSISPELFLSLRDKLVRTRPIKGTRPRGATPEEDRRLQAELEASLKERAELTMIVDLERNDLGRVCGYGSVRVDSPGELEVHPTVFHRVATITGRLHHRQNPLSLLRAMFPGGSVTGAPKIRAMEIIEELEPTRRGPYCGALGWLGANGDLELNLSIRTALVDENAKTAWYQAGGGIVAESHPAREYEETLVKAEAFFQVIQSLEGRRRFPPLKKGG